MSARNLVLTRGHVIVIIMISLGIFWTVSGIPWLFNLPLNETFVITFSNLGVFAAFLIMSTWAYLNYQFSSRKRTQLISILSIVANSIAIGIRIIDLRNAPAKYYGLAKVDGKWVPITDPIAAFFVLTGIATLLLSLFLVNRELKRLPEYVYPRRLKTINDVAFWLLVSAYILNFISLNLPSGFPLLIQTFSLASRLLVLASLSFYFTELLHNPLFITSIGGTGRHLIKKGVIGWGLIVFGNMGPQFSNVSEAWKVMLQLDQRTIMLNASALLIAAGLGDSFREYEYIIPFQGVNSRIVSVCYSFRHYDPTCIDKRLENRVPVVFGLFIPLTLMRMVSHILRVEKVIAKYRALHPTMQELSRNDVLEEMAVAILDAII